MSVSAHDRVHADVAEHPLVGFNCTMRSVFEAPPHGAAPERLRHGPGDVVAEDGQSGGRRVRWPGTCAQRAESGSPGNRPSPRRFGPSRAHLDAVHDGVAEELGQEPRRALIGRWHLRWYDPHPTDRQIVLPECCVDRQDLPPVDAADRPALGDVAPDGGQRHLPDQFCVGERIGQVMAGGPHGRPPRCRFERDESCAETASAEEKVSRCRQLRTTASSSAGVAVGLHAQEGACIHGAAPYRRHRGMTAFWPTMVLPKNRVPGSSRSRSPPGA